MCFLSIIYNNEFIPGSLQHFLPIALGLIFGTVVICFARKKCNLKRQQQIFNVLGFFISFFMLGYHLYFIFRGNYSITKDLPLFICSFMALFIFVFTYFRNYLMYEILLFWIIAGTTHGVITPDISNTFPEINFFRYWIVHLGLIIIALYATFVFDMRPTLKSVFKSFFALQVYMLVLFGVNYLLESNYSYLNKKPESTSVLDYFGNWPNYIFIVEVFLIPYFLVIYFPFYILKRTEKKNYLANN